MKRRNDKDPNTKQLLAEYRLMEQKGGEWLKLCAEIRDYIYPDAGRFLPQSMLSDDEGADRRTMIYDTTGEQALDLAAAGFMAGITKASTQWADLGFDTDPTEESEEEKEWLHKAKTRFFRYVSDTNYYNEQTPLYKELLGFGNACNLQEEDLESVGRFTTLTAGEYFVRRDGRGRPIALYRRTKLTAFQIKELYEDTAEGGLSDAIQSMIRQEDYKTEVTVLHIIRRRPEGAYDPEKGEANALLRKWGSYHLLESEHDDRYLKVSGYSYQPFAIPTGVRPAGFTYGRGPGMKALPDVKGLQRMEFDQLDAVEMMIRPPMNATNGLKPKGGTLFPGDTNYVPEATGQQSGYSPSYQIQGFPYQALIEAKKEKQAEVRKALFNDIFRTVTDRDGQMTAREIMTLDAERMMIVGPILESAQRDLLDVQIKGALHLLMAAGEIPPLPASVKERGGDIKIRYVSMLAQAQQLEEVNQFVKFLELFQAFAAYDPALAQMVKWESALRNAADRLGIDPDVLLSSDDFEELREQIEQQQQLAQTAELADTMAGAADKAGRAQVAPDNMLGRMMGAAAGGGVPMEGV
jgi:hypothetical protein